MAIFKKVDNRLVTDNSRSNQMSKCTKLRYEINHSIVIYMAQVESRDTILTSGVSPALQRASVPPVFFTVEREKGMVSQYASPGASVDVLSNLEQK